MSKEQLEPLEQLENLKNYKEKYEKQLKDIDGAFNNLKIASGNIKKALRIVNKEIKKHNKNR